VKKRFSLFLGGGSGGGFVKNWFILFLILFQFNFFMVLEVVLEFSLFLGGVIGVIGIYKIGKKVMFLPKLYFFMVLEVAGGQIDMQKSIFGLIEVSFWCSGGVFSLF
jgi:hypothetical protein